MESPGCFVGYNGDNNNSNVRAVNPSDVKILVGETAAGNAQVNYA